MNIGYRLLYLLGVTPWDQGRVPSELQELVEGPNALPPGRALDLGCGTGTESIYLAQHGWQATGVDFTGQALQAARRKSAAAGVSVAWIRGDVTRLSELGIGSDFGLLIDLGCYHGLSESQRDAYAREVGAVAAPGATFLLMSFMPGMRGPMPRGAGAEEVATRFGRDWDVIWTRKATGAQLPGPLRSADPTYYRLRRR